MNHSGRLRSAGVSMVAVALAACAPDPVTPGRDAEVDAVSADTSPAADATPVGADTPAPLDVAAPDAPPPPVDAPRPPADGPPPPIDAPPPPTDGPPPPPPDGPPPPMDAPPPPDAPPPMDVARPDAPPPMDVVAPPDAPPADAASDVRSCSDPGAATLATPPTVASATSNYNVTLLACTLSARALECALGVAHRIDITIDGSLRRIRANGIPNHDVGAFPNPGNPNTIAPQTYDYAMPVVPSGAGAAARIFGITLSGVVLDPGTAETWNNDMSWSYEALRYATATPYFSGTGATDTTRHPTSLGLDCNFAHVQPGGAYHYHGIPTGLMPSAPAATFVGWAGDGYPIYGRWDYSNAADTHSALAEMRSSYRLRSGTRPSGSAGPGGTYDGTFGQDWVYVAGLGDLDECGGRVGSVVLDGRTVSTYHYVLTNTWPYIPRCFHATPDASFRAMPMGGTDGGVPPGDGAMPPDAAADGGTMGPRSCTSTAGCTGACPTGSRGCTCATTPMGMLCIPTCTVTADCPAAPPGMTFTCRMGTCTP